MNLTAFLAENAIPAAEAKFVASRRFVGEDGQPMAWVIKPISSTEDDALRRESIRRVQVKKHQFQQEVDYNAYMGKLAAACTAFPDLNDAKLQQSYGVMGAEALLKAMLTPGEYAGYAAKVQEVCGFDSLEEQVETAKN